MLGSTTRAESAARLASSRMSDRPAERLAALDTVRVPVDELLRTFLTEQVDDLSRLHPALKRIGGEIADLVCLGGKRLRPAFVYWGHRATGADHEDGVLHAAGAVELLHNFALVHDDVMDRSVWRRGRPAVHVALAEAHAEDGLAGDGDWFGVAGAILAGDLAFVWSDRLFDEAPLPSEALARARRVFTELRVEVMAGQYLDLRLAGSVAATEPDALHVALLKSGRYTVTRPLQLGATIGGGDASLDAALVGYGDAIGLAFQLRDDVLGLYGDPDTTGKGAVEDLREGKRTLLILRALSLCGPTERADLNALLGNPEIGDEDADRAREVVRDCGALESVERLMDVYQERARAHLATVFRPARDALEELADLALFRVV
jgi:geranylgeranyl diphosphate synthase, type I